MITGSFKIWTPTILCALMASIASLLLCGCSQQQAPTEPEPTVSSHQLKQINSYYNEKQIRSEIFQFNEQGKLTSILFRDSALGDIEVRLTFTYDEEGRLLSADRDDCWLYFSNEEYSYNELGQLREHITYWGGGDLPDSQYEFTYDSQGNLKTEIELFPGDEEMVVANIYTYEYLYDVDNRILESRKAYEWSDSDYNYTTGFGTLPFYEYVNVSQYTYDEAGRILTLTQEDIPGELLTEDKTDAELMAAGSHMKYDYSYPYFIASEYANGNTTLSIHDAIGNEIWSVIMSECEIFTNPQGYILFAQDDAGYTWEFQYQ